MRKVGAKGAPAKGAFKAAAKTAKKPKEKRKAKKIMAKKSVEAPKGFHWMKVRS